MSVDFHHVNDLHCFYVKEGSAKGFFLMNIFQQHHDQRLNEWYKLRKQYLAAPLLEKCMEFDKWWQQAPLTNHHLHMDEVSTWPSPWELLHENIYCEVARGLGICYTLIMTGVTGVSLAHAQNKFGEDAIIVIVQDQYVLNYWPNTVQDNQVSDFSIKRVINIEPIYQHLK
jgi:hypothetical protein